MVLALHFPSPTFGKTAILPAWYSQATSKPKHSRGSLTLAFTGVKDGLLAPPNAVQCYGIHHQLVPNSPQPGSEGLKPEMGMPAWEQSKERAQRCLAHCKKEN